MHWIDWAIVAGMFVTLGAIAFYTKRVSRSVADFLAANRCGRRYLLTMAEGMATVGAVSVVGYWESFREAGFTADWWSQINKPVGVMIALSGWIIYRYRQTRAMTMAQFFEMRYSRSFRVYAGIVGWGAGVINYGIFPAVTARLLIYLTGLPVYTWNPGPLELDLTMGAVMFILLGVAVFLTFSGGQITVMVTDFVQGQLVNIVFLIILVWAFVRFSWPDIVKGLEAAPPTKSRTNPFDTGGHHDFNMWFFFILAFTRFYGHMAWQGTQGYYCSAINAHEAKMAQILAEFRALIFGLMIMVLPIVVYAVMNNPDFAGETAAIQQSLGQIDDEGVRKQQTTTIALVHLLPVGIIGLLVAVLIGAAISTDDTYLHAWGSIFIQDVILPFRRTPLSAEAHLRWLRWSILGVAVFAWFFSMLVPLGEAIFMFFAITGAIYIGGAGVAIIGGLYWKRGTTAGAWAGMITGSALSVGSILFNRFVWPVILPGLRESWPAWEAIHRSEAFPIHSAWISLINCGAAIIMYVGVSLLWRARPVDMDRLMHRGKYEVAGEQRAVRREASWGFKALGMGDEFTTGDRAIYLFSLGWVVFLVGSFLLGTAWHLLVAEIPNEAWINWWLFKIVLTAVMGVIATIWFLWGGIVDLKKMFGDLRTAQRDDRDDGTVVDHHNLADEQA